MNQSLKQPINQVTKQVMNQSSKQLTNQSTYRPIHFIFHSFCLTNGVARQRYSYKSSVLGTQAKQPRVRMQYDTAVLWRSAGHSLSLISCCAIERAQRLGRNCLLRNRRRLAFCARSTTRAPRRATLRGFLAGGEKKVRGPFSCSP